MSLCGKVKMDTISFKSVLCKHETLMLLTLLEPQQADGASLPVSAVYPRWYFSKKDRLVKNILFPVCGEEIYRAMCYGTADFWNRRWPFYLFVWDFGFIALLAGSSRCLSMELRLWNRQAFWIRLVNFFFLFFNTYEGIEISLLRQTYAFLSADLFLTCAVTKILPGHLLFTQ